MPASELWLCIRGEFCAFCRNDVHGARDTGCYAWLWGEDVLSFKDVERRIVECNIYDELD